MVARSAPESDRGGRARQRGRDGGGVGRRDAASRWPPAVVWGCRRIEPIVERLRGGGRGRGSSSWRACRSSRTSRPPRSAGCSKTDPAVQPPPPAGRARFGTLDAYCCARLGDGARTEPSTAARTQLQALAAPGRWDRELWRLSASSPRLAAADRRLDRRAGDAVPGCRCAAMLVDQTAALAGHGCLARRARPRPPTAPACSCSQNAGADAAGRCRRRCCRSVAWQLGGATAYALDGGVFSAGTVDHWLRDGTRRCSPIAAETRRWRGRCPTPAACVSCPRWPAGRALVAIGRARRVAGMTAAHDPRAPRARGAGRALLPRARHRRAGVAGSRPAGAARGRRPDRQRLAAAAPGRRARHPGGGRRRPRRPRWASPPWPASAPACCRSTTWPS